MASYWCWCAFWSCVCDSLVWCGLGKSLVSWRLAHFLYQKEVAVQEVHIDLDAFCGWLCLHEYDEVGRPGIWFHSPLAVWLSDVTGHVYGVDGRVYGRASWDACCWLPLPDWAVVFSSWVEQSLVRVIVGAEALDVLAQVERTLTMRGRSCGRRRSASGKGV